MDVGRRGFLSLMTGPMLLVAASGRSDASGDRALARALPRLDRFGTCVTPEHLRGDPGVRRIVTDLCSSLTPEYHLQWSSLQPGPGRYRFGPVDDIVGFARHRGMALIGHALLWEQGTPGWGTPDWVRERLEEQPDWSLVRRHFETVLARYGDAISLWNVVNEPVEVGDRSDGLRSNVFLRAFGPDYVAEALRTAREFAPGARLMINDYSLEYDNPVDEARRRATLALLDNLRRRGVPIDAFGLQGHLDLGKGGIGARSLGRFLQEVADLGLEIQVTELDVLERDFTLPIEERDRRVADETERFLDVVLDQKAVTRVTTWGISDRYSWLRRYPLAGFDASDNRGLPFDEASLPKPMALALSRALGLAAI
jgi:endo-1,4-beta-xylanase